MIVPIFLFAFIALIAVNTCQAATNVVLLYSKTGQLVTSSTLGWQSFNGDKKQINLAVPAGQYTDAEDSYTMYVCRVLIEGIFTSGHTKQHNEKIVCIGSMHMEVRTHFAFDILINKGHGAKLAWLPWSKFSATIPNGAISVTSAGHVIYIKIKLNHNITLTIQNLQVDDNFVARRKVEASEEHLEHHMVNSDYNVGRFAPKISLGKIIVCDRLSEKVTILFSIDNRI